MLAPVVLACIVVSYPYPLFVLALLAVTLSFWELRQLLKAPRTLPVLTLLAIALPFFAAEVITNRNPIQLAAYSFLFFVLGSGFAFVGSGRYVGSTATTDLAGLWIASPLACILMLHSEATPTQMLTASHQLVHQGPLLEPRSAVLLVFVPLWLADIAGMLAGKYLGKRLLWPSVSPKKTVVGSVANLLTAVGSALLLSLWIQHPPTFSKPIACYLVCGLFVGVFGQLGDLFESYIKRQRGVKDSGTVIPGHGGVLDRIDSLLFSAPFVVMALLLWPA